jgi:hypothetical protein
VTGKGDVTGLKEQTDIPYDALFTFENGATASDVSTLTGTNVVSGTLPNTIQVQAAHVDGEDVALSFSVSSGVVKAGSVVLKAVSAA